MPHSKASILACVLSYIDRGWPAFPVHTVRDRRCSCGDPSCGNAGKHPRVAGGFQVATTDRHQVFEWWRRWPESNVGIATGARAGFFVLDVDSRHFGLETLADLEAEHGNLPSTVRAFTGGGGQHILFRARSSEKVPSRVAAFQGIDVRGDGGYIVAPPSAHASGCEYIWDADAHPDDTMVVEAPAWLLTALAAPRDVGPKPSREWAQILEHGKRPGARNDSMARILGHLLGRGVDVVVATDLVMAWNRYFVSPPQDDGDVLATVTSIARREFAKMRERRARHGR